MINLVNIKNEIKFGWFLYGLASFNKIKKFKGIYYFKSRKNIENMSEYNIKVEFDKKTFSFSCQDDQDIISAASINGIDLPNSCCSGVCTSCASMVIDGSIDQEDAMGLNEDLREKGFALLCVAYPESDLHVVIGDQVEDDLYNDQFGKYQKWN